MMATAKSLSITFEIEPVVKLLCKNLQCAYNLYNRHGWAACNLKMIIIGKDGVCVSRLTSASTRPGELAGLRDASTNEAHAVTRPAGDA